MKILEDKNILFVSHTVIPLFLNVFRGFTSPKCNVFTAISHPLHPGSGVQSKLSVYRNTERHQYTVASGIPGPFFLNFLKDYFLTVYWVIKTGIRYNIAFGTNNLNTLSLLALKKLGRVKKVVFINIDYTPSRYDNPILNALYHWFDRVCCYSADVLWNGSPRTNEARIRNGMDEKKIVQTVIIPDGSYFNENKRLPLSKIHRLRIIFLGNMRPVMGVELILDAFTEVLKTVPTAGLLLIGGGSELEKYKRRAKNLGLGNRAVFTGFLESHDDVDELLRTGSIGLAPFVPDKKSYEFYSDVGKPKAYLAAGMPVIITRVPAIADEIERQNAGIVIGYNKKELTAAIVRLLTDTKRYEFFRKNAIRLSKKYTWSHVLTKAFTQTVPLLEER